MNTVAKLTIFVALLIVLFVGGLAVGAAVGPLDNTPTPAPSHVEHTP